MADWQRVTEPRTSTAVAEIVARSAFARPDRKAPPLWVLLNRVRTGVRSAQEIRGLLRDAGWNVFTVMIPTRDDFKQATAFSVERASRRAVRRTGHGDGDEGADQAWLSVRTCAQEPPPPTATRTTRSSHPECAGHICGQRLEPRQPTEPVPLRDQPFTLAHWAATLPERDVTARGGERAAQHRGTEGAGRVPPRHRQRARRRVASGPRAGDRAPPPPVPRRRYPHLGALPRSRTRRHDRAGGPPTTRRMAVGQGRAGCTRQARAGIPCTRHARLRRQHLQRAGRRATT